MFAVIFKAEIAQLDAEYSDMAAHMRELAISQYGCTQFTSCTEGNREIAISTGVPGPDPALEAGRSTPGGARQGRSKWYSAYTVEVVELVRSYGSGSLAPL